MNILIVGTVRNVENVIVKHVSKIYENTQVFSSVHWCLIESDSSDGTLYSLSHLKKTIPNFNFISLGDLSTIYPYRTSRLAHCRNSYVHFIRNNISFYKNFYVLVIDLDVDPKYFSSKTILSCFNGVQWDACFANSRFFYYDIFALRAENWCEEDPFLEFEQSNKKFGAAYYYFRAILSKMKHIPCGSSWISVTSAFGGAGIYKVNNFLISDYQLDIDGCEHINFHKKLILNNKKLYINPGFMVFGLSTHCILALLKFFGLLLFGAKFFNYCQKLSIVFRAFLKL